MNLQEIEDRAAKATPGPWWFEDLLRREGAEWNVVLMGDRDGLIQGSLEDKAFIAHAREDIPALISFIRDLQLERSQLVAKLEVSNRRIKTYESGESE